MKTTRGTPQQDRDVVAERIGHSEILNTIAVKISNPHPLRKSPHRERASGGWREPTHTVPQQHRNAIVVLVRYGQILNAVPS